MLTPNCSFPVCPWQIFRPRRALFVPLQVREEMSVHKLTCDGAGASASPGQPVFSVNQDLLETPHLLSTFGFGGFLSCPYPDHPGGLLKSTTASSLYVMGSSRSLLQALLKCPDVPGCNNAWSATGM